MPSIRIMFSIGIGLGLGLVRLSIIQTVACSAFLGGQELQAGIG